MGGVADVYDDLDADVSYEEFEEAVEQKVEQMGGLADEETAAMLVAHEVEDEEVNGIADIEPGMDQVTFLGKVVDVGEMRTFERDGEDDPPGRVANVEVADESARVRVAFWDEMAQAIDDGELEVGQVLQIGGRPKEGYSGVEVNADDVELAEDAEVDVQVEDLDSYRVEDLSLGLSDVDLRGKLLDTDAVRTFDRDDGSEGRVANLVVGDETGRIRITLWDEKADRAEELEPGGAVEIVDGYVRERDGDLELHVGSRGTVEEIDAEIEYVPETADIADVEIGQRVDIAGGVVETGEKRTFERDDGSEGQVRNVRVKDDTGEIRVALWGEKADADVELADGVVVTDAEIQDGWRDDVEASAGWRSTITVTDAASQTPAGGGGGRGGDADAAAADLSAFDGDSAGTGTGAGAAGDADGAATAAASGTDADADADAGDAGRVTFTGTVVQAGDPVVLDDGTETRSVRTDADLRLGEEVTVEGELAEGRIDADRID